MAPKKNKKKPNGKARADEISADFGYDESEPDVEIKDEETAADLKVRGNECVKSGDHAVAIKLFTVAIERHPIVVVAEAGVVVVVVVENY